MKKLFHFISLSIIFNLEIENCFAQPGSLDLTFSSDGKTTTPIGNSIDEGYSVAIQTDGKIVVAGRSYNGSDYDFALVRYNTDGSLDSTFSSDGKVTTPIGSSTDEGYSVAIQTDGKIIVAGNSSYDFAVVRYNIVCSPINFSQSPTICNGQNITVGSNTYTASGTYIDTLTANGCDSIVATNLIVNPLPTATITPSGATTFCQGNSVTLTASAATSYLWSSSAITQSITVSTSGNYSVTVTDGNSCSATSTPTAVTVNPLPTKPTITANGTTLTSSSSIGNQWYLNGNIILGATSQTYTVTQNGIYTVVVTNSNGCSAYTLTRQT